MIDPSSDPAIKLIKSWHNKQCKKKKRPTPETLLKKVKKTCEDFEIEDYQLIYDRVSKDLAVSIDEDENCRFERLDDCSLPQAGKLDGLQCLH